MPRVDSGNTNAVNYQDFINAILNPAINVEAQINYTTEHVTSIIRAISSGIDPFSDFFFRVRGINVLDTLDLNEEEERTFHELLFNSLNDRAREVRAAVATKLAYRRVEEDRVIHRIATLLFDTETRFLVIDAARDALVFLATGNEHVRQLVVNHALLAQRHYYQPTRLSATIMLGQLGNITDEVINPLIASSRDDEDYTVRASSVTAISNLINTGNFNDNKLVEAITCLLLSQKNDRTKTVKDTARRSITDISQRNPLIRIIVELITRIEGLELERAINNAQLIAARGMFAVGTANQPQNDANQTLPLRPQ